LNGVVSVSVTVPDRFPAAPPATVGAPEAPPAPNVKLLIVAVLFASPSPLLSFSWKSSENGPDGFPMSDAVLMSLSLVFCVLSLPYGRGNLITGTRRK
jgi:hypothetical protein